MESSKGTLMTISRDLRLLYYLKLLTEPALQLAHEGLGHNGIPQTYALLRQQYYWKGLKSSVTKHVKQCTLCQKHNK